MVPDALDSTDPWGRPPQGGASDYEATAVVMSQWRVVLPTPGGGYAGGRDGDD